MDIAAGLGADTRSRRDATANFELCLLAGVRLADGLGHFPLSLGSQRLLAFLALHRHGIRRDLTAGSLSPKVSEPRAHASLRSALKRLGRAGEAVSAGNVDVSLADSVSVDLYDTETVAYRLLDNPASVRPDAAAVAIPGLSAELLPGWYDDWAVLAAENWRQLRLHALEAAAEVLAAAGRFGEAACAAHSAVSADPLRESPHAVLIRLHLGEGNQSEAVREFERDTAAYSERNSGLSRLRLCRLYCLH